MNDMRKLLILLMAGIAVGATVGCKEKKNSDHIIAQKVVAKAPSGPVRMQDYVQTKDLEWLGASYNCEIVRIADDSLAMVKDESGQKFVDNRISLEIRRKDGSVFFRKSFTKKDFDECLDNDYRKTGILEGIVFDKIDGPTLVFAASVSHPQTDEYIPLLMRISRMGNVSIARDTQMDTSAQGDGDEDEV